LTCPRVAAAETAHGAVHQLQVFRRQIDPIGAAAERIDLSSRTGDIDGDAQSCAQHREEETAPVLHGLPPMLSAAHR
jgi:hypothetical protein